MRRSRSPSERRLSDEVSALILFTGLAVIFAVIWLGVNL